MLDVPARASCVLWAGLVILFAEFGLCAPARSEERTVTDSPVELRRFSRETLLRRFDVNGNGKLDAKERTVLRDAFGGIDVPMLPAKPFDYIQVKLPEYIKQSHLDASDNTPEGNSLTDRGATLGRVLFYDKQLSRNNAISCAACHDQQAAFADARPFSMGFQGGRTKRNAMGLANLRYTNLKGRRAGLFWDERAATLEAQVLMPIQDKLEMGMNLKDLEKKLQKRPYYPPLFKAAFGSSEVASDRIAQAIAQFMRSLVSLNSKFDQAAAASVKADNDSADFKNFTAEENLGKSLFIEGIGGITEFACAMCHLPPTFNMDKANNIGLDLKYKDPGLGALGRPSNHPFTPSNEGKFKAPSLRNIELTAPYMHDGRFKTLKQVIEHYSTGVHRHKNLTLAFDAKETEKRTSGFQFSKEEKAALVAFLKTLTDKTFTSEAKFSDPFVRAGK